MAGASVDVALPTAIAIWQRALVLRLLGRRLGELPAEVLGAVESAGADDLDRYADRLVVANEVMAVLEVVEG